jgi:hypothetical protein
VGPCEHVFEKKARYYRAFLTVRRFRPLARRRERTWRPSFFAIRDRNPWTLARRRFFGWNVRFGMLFLG